MCGYNLRLTQNKVGETDYSAIDLYIVKKYTDKAGFA